MYIESGLNGHLSFEDKIEEITKNCREALLKHCMEGNRELRHLMLATLIHTYKAEANLTYQEIASSYGFIAPDTLKSLANRRIYCSESTFEGLAKWLCWMLAANMTRKVIESQLKDKEEIFRQLQIKGTN